MSGIKRACFHCGIVNLQLQTEMADLKVTNEKLNLENRRLKKIENRIKRAETSRELASQTELELASAGVRK